MRLQKASPRPLLQSADILINEETEAEVRRRCAPRLHHCLRPRHSSTSDAGKRPRDLPLLATLLQYR